MYTHTHTHAHTHARTKAHSHTCVHTRIYTRVHTHTCAHTYKHAHKHIHIHIHTTLHTHTPWCTFKYTRTHRYTHARVQRTHEGIKTNQHTGGVVHLCSYSESVSQGCQSTRLMNLDHGVLGPWFESFCFVVSERPISRMRPEFCSYNISSAGGVSKVPELSRGVDSSNPFLDHQVKTCKMNSTEHPRLFERYQTQLCHRPA